VAKNRGGPSTIRLLERPIGAMIPAIETGRIDAGSMNEPALQVALSSPKLRLLTPAWSALAPRFFYNAWFATTSYAAANPTDLHQLPRQLPRRRSVTRLSLLTATCLAKKPTPVCCGN
jgi:hypothetical protein